MDQTTLERIVKEALEEFETPSLSISVWDGQRELHAAGGMADIERGIPATPETYYAIGSSTKAFTATALCILADEGKLALDDPVKKYLPEFKMHDGYVTEHLTIRDILCHRCGLPRHDAWLYINCDLTLGQAVEKLPYLHPAYPPRYRFHYQNHMFMLATVLVETVSGRRFEDFIKERILTPLHMEDTHVFEDMIDDADRRKSTPYDGHGHGLRRAVRENMRGVAGAGSMYSTTPDMLKWLHFRLHGDERVVSHRLRQDSQSPQMLIRPGECLDSAFPGVTGAAYGMGWFVYSYQGHVVIHHGGAVNGYRSMQMFVPDSDLAVSVLINSNATDATDGVAYALVDRLLGLPAFDWGAHCRRVLDEAYRPYLEAAAELRQGPAGQAYDAAEYTGTYSDPGYGSITFHAENGALFLMLAGERLTTICRERDRFIMLFDAESQIVGAHFLRDGQGAVCAVDIPFEPTLPDDAVRFVRK